MLSRGFIQIEKRNLAVSKRFKGMLPRRESERKSHALARHCDVLSAVETRISMLNMTYMKYIDSNLICFIPGKVLDEIQSILNLVESGVHPPRTHELLQELRDISSMAMEHFDEHLLPRINKMQASIDNNVSFAPVKSISKLLVAQSAEIRKIKKTNAVQKQQLHLLTQQIHKLSKKVKRQNIRLKSQSNKIDDEQAKIQSNQNKINEHEATIADLKKQIDEWDQKFADLTTEINRAREEVQKSVNRTKEGLGFAESKPPPFCIANIQPRISNISIPIIRAGIERKRQSPITSALEIPNKLPRIIDNKQEITNLINENITKNISKSITDKFETTVKKAAGSIFKTPDFSAFVSSSIETLLKNPLTNIKSRKRNISQIST